MTCAKREVWCTIVTKDGGVFLGSNSCESPQTVCPRGHGEGYEKCVSICRQPAHAEISALLKAGSKAHGAVAYLHGITHSCRYCQEALFKAGIKWLSITKCRWPVCSGNKPSDCLLCPAPTPWSKP